MNSFEEPYDAQKVAGDSVFWAEIDRMVDGELSDKQQRSLLERLDESPAGWKALALAYVEASAWKSHFSAPDAMAESNAAESNATSPEVAEPRQPNSRRDSSSSSTFAAIAVLLVFGLGIWLGRPQVELPPGPSQIADNPEQSQGNVENSPTQDEPEQPTLPVARNADQSIPESVQVVYNDGQSDVLRVVDVPISKSVAFESPQQLDEFWNGRQSAIPAELRAELERSGHQIRESRDFWPAQLPDGRPVVIPVSKVHVANNPLAYP